MSADQSIFHTLQQEINARDKVQGISQLDILNLPPPLDSTLNSITRRGVITLSEFSQDLDMAQEQGENLAKLLVKKGYLRVVEHEDELAYKVRYAPKRKRKVPTKVWDALDF